MNIRIITILIAGAVFTAGLIMGFGGYVFAGKDYNSSISNSSSIGKIHEYVGNILLPYGFGGMEINRVNDALDVGITEDAFKVMLGEILGNVGSGATSGEGVSNKVQAILLEFDKLGISKDSTQGLDAPTLEFTEGAAPSAVDSSGKSVTGGELRTPATTLPQQPSVGTSEQRFKSIDGLDSETRVSSFFDTYEEKKGSAMKSIQDLKAAESEEEFNKIRQKLNYRRVLLQQGVQALRQDLRENAQELRENFRENVRTTIGHVDHGKTGRIAVAHGKGLRMINRYRSAIARFDHILGRMESRIEKIGIEAQAQARATEKGKIKDYFPAAIPLIEEAKNTQALNKAKLVELQAKYESLLLGENAGGIADEARAIAKELKSEIEKLHALLDDILQEAVEQLKANPRH